MAQESWKVEQDETGCQPPEGPVLCINDCGFFGSAATMNLCSKCYRDVVLKQTKASKVSLFEAVQTEQLDPADRVEKDPEYQVFVTPGSSSELSVGDVASSPDSSQQSAKLPANRCRMCNKRVALTGFKCRCGDLFCSLHRYSDKHNCPFDYRAAGRDAITKANPVIKPDKLEKI